MKQVLIEDSNDSGQPDKAQHLKACHTATLFQCQPAISDHMCLPSFITRNPATS